MQARFEWMCMSGMVHCPLGLQCDLPKVLCNECTSLRARETCPPQSRCSTAIASPELFKAQVSRGAAKKCCRLHNDLSPACWSSRWQIVQGSNPITAEGSTLRSLVFAGRAGVHCTMSVRVTYECTHWHLLLQLHCQPTRSWLRRTSQGKALGNQIR